MTLKKTFIIFILFSCLAAQSEILPLNKSFIEAEIQVESSGNDFAIGDGRKAIGALQIHYSYWCDAIKYDKTIGGTYQNCTNRAYSIKIMTSYLNHYGRKYIKNNDFFSLARIHNGSINGLTNPRTIGYAQKVVREMK